MDKLIPLTEAAGKGLAFLIILLLTRLLPIEDYGTFNYILSIVLWMSVFMDGGLNTLVFTKSVQGEIREIEIYFNGKLLLSAIAATIFLTGLIIAGADNIELFALYIVFVFFTSAIALFKMLARGSRNHSLDIQCVLFEPGLRAVLLITLSLFGVIQELYDVYYVFLMSAGIAFIILFRRVYRVYGIKLSFRSAKRTLAKTLVKSRYYLAYYFLLVGIQRIDFVMINARVGEYGLALFSGAYNIYAAIQIVFSAYVMTRIKYIIENPDCLNRVWRELFICGVLCIAGVYFGSEHIFQIIYPQEYQVAHVFLKVIILALPFYLLAYSAIFLINHIHLAKVNAFVIGLLFLTKITLLYTLNFTDVESYVYMAAAFEAILGFVFFLIVRLMNIPRLLKGVK